MFAALGRFAARGRWPIIVLWLAVALAGAVFGGRVFDRATDVAALDPGAESATAQRRIDALTPEGDKVLAVVRGTDVYDPALITSVTAVVGELRATPGVRKVESLYTGAGAPIGADNRSTLVTVELNPGADLDRVTAALHRIAAPEVLVGGELPAKRSFADQAVRDAALGESVAFAVLVVVLIAILGGLVAGLLPLVVALASVATALLCLLGLSGLTAVSEYTVNVVTLLGVGLAVDYCLLLIARFREERTAGGALTDQLARTMATAGRTVLISGAAVGVAMAGLAVFAEPLLAAMAVGGLIVVVLATLLGLTLAPALIAVAHRRIPAPGERTWVRRVAGRRSGAARQPTLLARFAVFAQRRPWPVTLGVAAALALLALPLAGINLANSDARALPRGAEARAAAEIIQRDFRGGRAEPVTVLIEADAGSPEVRDLLNALGALPNSGKLDVRFDVPAGATIVDLNPPGATSGPQSLALVKAVRALPHPVPVLVAGPAAEVVDGRESVAGRLPLVAGVLLVATALLLFALTGSLVVPLKALAMNGLTLAATLGVLVAVFQWGWGGPLLRFDPWGGLDITTPVLLFVFLFGLTMDYEVFLLARVREEWGRRRRGNASAVLAGITRSGPVVTAAAVCMTIVFLGFTLGRLTAVKEIGVGMAVAVVLDVTVVRGLLLPAIMTLLGDRNWWPTRPLSPTAIAGPPTVAARRRAANDPHVVTVRNRSG